MTGGITAPVIQTAATLFDELHTRAAACRDARRSNRFAHSALKA
mgnify:CR=1 FL=1